jgi:hypothetical protein
MWCQKTTSRFVVVIVPKQKQCGRKLKSGVERKMYGRSIECPINGFHKSNKPTRISSMGLAKKDFQSYTNNLEE